MRPLVVTHLFKIQFPTYPINFVAKFFIKMYRFQLIYQKLNSKIFLRTLVVTHFRSKNFLTAESFSTAESFLTAEGVAVAAAVLLLIYREICYLFENRVYIKIDKSKLLQTCVRHEGDHNTQNLYGRLAICSLVAN